MIFPEDQVAELKEFCPEVSVVQEAGCSYLLLPELHLPDGCSPATLDALLCPSARDGYASRLFFAENIQGKVSRNWGTFRIVERNWHAFSWKTEAGLRLAQMIAVHLGGLR